MATRAWDHIETNTEQLFGFIAIDEHTHKGCVIQDSTDLGARLVMIGADAVPGDFVLYSFAFDKALPCKAVSRSDEVITAWFNCDRTDIGCEPLTGAHDANRHS
ncbi:hypothetical protein [Methylobacterium sp. J-068]|uniref:hypothetical protein n=1 Tax=Methylobacterium sp. J-068 TaxID=2836649 RepID=UPI001FBAE1B0|nr:hypothetical protein [Methylobacterium sp. J-068]MCJ2034012.1 hypothetical protein [Methylobacterium sp. J-068]